MWEKSRKITPQLKKNWRPGWWSQFDVSINIGWVHILIVQPGLPRIRVDMLKLFFLWDCWWNLLLEMEIPCWYAFSLSGGQEFWEHSEIFYCTVEWLFFWEETTSNLPWLWYHVRIYWSLDGLVNKREKMESNLSNWSSYPKMGIDWYINMQLVA